MLFMEAKKKEQDLKMVFHNPKRSYQDKHAMLWITGKRRINRETDPNVKEYLQRELMAKDLRSRVKDVIQGFSSS